MNTQELLIANRLTHLRDLKSENARLKDENARLRAEAASLRAHFEVALIAAEDLRSCRRLEIWDGWNLLLGATKEARDRAALLAQAEETAVDGVRVWILYDGPDENVRQSGNVRISYTGGEGTQRADRLICDYLRMTKYLGLADRVSVRTNDKNLLREVHRIIGRGGHEGLDSARDRSERHD